MFKIRKKLILVFSFFVHIIFLISIFDIYFKSPLVPNVQPHINNIRGAAKRLILFVGDGLRADTFFEIYMKNKVITPYLRQIIEKRGRWGISYTTVPTESRPGHVALIAGFYEDPSAIFRGWKDNPVDFDSVFNRSSLTVGWGSPDILSIYPSEFEEFSGMEGSATRLSLWSFENFKKWLLAAKNDKYLYKKLNQDRVIFFLHLLGIDTAGHSHKPYSEEYKQNIELADTIVQETEKLILEFYNFDNRSTFLFTSDHGMTDWGSHGEGSASETETPYVIWGAGILKPQVTQESHSPVVWNLNYLQRNDIKQADMVPLMSILLGTIIPVNSIGVLPINLLDYSLAEKSTALLLNAQQILAQFIQKRKNVEESTINYFYKPYLPLSDGQEKKLLIILKTQLNIQRYEEVIKGSLDLISLSLKGLTYYHNYYQKLLLFCISVSYIGWICWLLLNISTTVDMLLLFNILFGIALLNVLYVTYCFSVKQGLSYLNQLISWIILILLPILPLFSSRKLVLRLLNLYSSLGVVSLLFSITHDALFLPLFSLHLFMWLVMENEEINGDYDSAV
ncbi:hypothetical protein PGB90_008223 [Kerria lacca]